MISRPLCSKSREKKVPHGAWLLVILILKSLDEIDTEGGGEEFLEEYEDDDEDDDEEKKEKEKEEEDEEEKVENEKEDEEPDVRVFFEG